MYQSVAVRRKFTTSCWDRLEDEDLFVEILKRLTDVKHMHQCKSVSKRWYKTISSDYFVRCFTLFHKNISPPFALFYHHLSGFCSASKRHAIFRSPGFSLDFLPPPPGPPPPTFPYQGWSMPKFFVSSAAISPISRVVSTSNGLLLRCDTLSSKSQSCQYYVCNPLTRQWLTIPIMTCKLVRLGFVCNSTGSFRIVRIPIYDDEMTPVVSLEIYASETGKWSESVVENDTEVLYCPQHSSAIACNGLLHWRSSKYIFVYDPYNNKRNNRNRLKFPSDMAKECGLGECKGQLRCIIPGYMDTFMVWVLKDYDNEGEWSLVKRICLNEMTIGDLHVPGWMPVDLSYKCLCFHPFDDDVVFLWQFFRIVSCNLRAKTVTHVTHLQDLYGDKSNSSFHPVGLPVVLPLWPISLSPSRIVEEH